MVASKTSIIVAAVALGAASVYAAPAAVNKDITLARREADEAALIAREFDDELYAREFFDELDARDFEDDALEARDFEEDELYARELYEDELEAREFDDFEELSARALEVTPQVTPPKPSSTATPSATTTSASATSSVGAPSSTSTDAVKDKKVLASTSASTPDSDEKDRKHKHKHKHSHRHHDVCKPYKKAYKLLTGQAYGEHKLHEHGLHAHAHEHEHEHDLHEHDLHAHTQTQEHDAHKTDAHKHESHHRHHPHHRHHRHRHDRHHQLTAEEIAHKCAPVIARLARYHEHQHHAAVDVTTVHPAADSKAFKIQTPDALKLQTPETLKVQTPTKAKRGLTQLWARVVGNDKPAPDAKSVSGNPDAAGPAPQSFLAAGAESAPLPGGLDKPVSNDQQGPYPGQHKKHHHHHHHHHRHRNCHLHPHSKHCRHHHGHHHSHHHRHRHNRYAKQDATGAAGLEPAKNIAEPAGGPVSDATAVGNGAPVTAVDPAARVQRRSLDDEIWERSLASSLGLDEDYFTKRFYDEDAFEY